MQLFAYSYFIIALYFWKHVLEIAFIFIYAIIKITFLLLIKNNINKLIKTDVWNSN